MKAELNKGVAAAAGNALILRKQYSRGLSISARLNLARICDANGMKAKAAGIRAGIADQLMENLQ